MTESSRAANAGFTLLEILVAFTIATTALGLLFRIHANSTATVVLSEQYREATTLAQTLIAELSVTEPSIAFSRSGSTPTFDWSVRAERYTGSRTDAAADPSPYLLRRIVVEVGWTGRDRERDIMISTIKPFFEPKP
jgi:general secretion pathway protein I